MRQKQEQKYRELEQDRNVGVYALRARLDNDPFGRYRQNFLENAATYPLILDKEQEHQ